MPVEVTKKLVAADCALAGLSARTANEATARNQHETIFTETVIEVLPVVFQLSDIKHVETHIIPAAPRRNDARRSLSCPGRGVAQSRDPINGGSRLCGAA